jgi:hypothetical protein
MILTDVEALYATIEKDPDDLALYGILADALEATGDRERAEGYRWVMKRDPESILNYTNNTQKSDGVPKIYWVDLIRFEGQRTGIPREVFELLPHHIGLGSQDYWPAFGPNGTNGMYTRRFVLDHVAIAFGKLPQNVKDRLMKKETE